MHEMLLSMVVLVPHVALHAPVFITAFSLLKSANTVLVRLGAEHVVLQEAGQDTQ